MLHRSISNHFIKIFGGQGMSPHIFSIQKWGYPFIFPQKIISEYAERQNHQSPRVTSCSVPSHLVVFLAAFTFFQSICVCNMLIHLWLAQQPLTALFCQTAMLSRSSSITQPQKQFLVTIILGSFRIQFRCSSVHVQCRMQPKCVSVWLLWWPR